MFYGSGMPILYFIAAIGMLTLYWLDKIMILYWHRKPEMLDLYLAYNISKWYKWALVLHFIGGAMMFSNSKILPNKNAQSFSSFGIWIMNFSKTLTFGLVTNLRTSVYIGIFFLVVFGFLFW